MTKLLALLFLFALALAGCVSSDDAETDDADAKDGSDDADAQEDGSDPTGDGTSTGGDSGSGNETGDEPADEPPTAILSPDTVEGEAPLTVNFSLDADDEDPGNATWSFDADGDGAPDDEGTGLPAESTFEYTQAGVYTAALYVSDARTTSEANVTIEVQEASGSGEDPSEEPEPQEDEWVIFMPDGTCLAKGAEAAGPLWLHDRPGEGEPYGSGFVTGGGTWVYEETNDLEGLQVGGSAESGPYQDCENPDHLIF